MRSILLLAAAMTNPAHAQAAPSLSVVAATPALYDRAPWWMREPVIASLGEVRTELAPNRAVLGAGYEVVDRSAAEATKAAAAKVRALAAALSAYGPEAVRITTSFSTRPLYAQYRDKDGKILENERADKVDRYAVTANVGVELRDLRLTERAYATLLAAKPTSTSTPYFRLQPSNATNTELFRLAVADAARRAKEAAEEAGARLGAVKLIDPTGRACSTDVLVAGGPRTSGEDSTGVSEVVVTAERRGAPSPAMAPPPPPPPPDALQVEDLQLPLQPPPQELTREACVVYALAGGA